MTKASVVTMVCAAALAAACAESQKPTENLVAAQVAMRTASKVPGSDVPQAQLHRRYAEEQLQGAKRLIKEGDNDGAKSLLERAQADAEYAQAIAHKAEVERSVMVNQQGDDD